MTKDQSRTERTTWDKHGVDVDQYRGTYVLYSQRKDAKRNARAREEAAVFIEHAVRYQDPAEWDDLAPMEDENEDETNAGVGRNKIKGMRTNKDIATHPFRHMMIAVVRDPVERFISAVGQVTSSRFIANGQNGQHRQQCGIEDEIHNRSILAPKSIHKHHKHGRTAANTSNTTTTNTTTTTTTNTTTTASDIFRCFVRLLKNEDTSYWLDLHFTPMILELSFATMQKDVPVAVFHFDHVPDILGQFGANPEKKTKGK